MSKGIFITGTDTDVGKTYIAALIVKKMREDGLDCGYYKAAASGIERDESGRIHSDMTWVQKVSGLSDDVELLCPYTYQRAVSPHLACKKEGLPVEMSVVKKQFEKVCALHPFVVMEGSGGILCPIRQDEKEIWLEDIINELGLTCVLVADAGLGTINHTVLTIFYMRAKKIPVNGIIFNHYHPGNEMEEDNIAMIQNLTGLPVIAKVEDHSENLPIDGARLAEYFCDFGRKGG